MQTIITFIGFLAFVAIYSFLKLRREKLSSSEGYFLGGRSLTGIVIAGSMLLTNISTEHLIGMMDGEYSQGFSLEIELERKIGYYIFKVIFPIILILSICWASVWINPRELESRLTITIVTNPMFCLTK